MQQRTFFFLVCEHAGPALPAVEKAFICGRKLEWSVFLLCFSTRLLAKHSLIPFFPPDVREKSPWNRRIRLHTDKSYSTRTTKELINPRVIYLFVEDTERTRKFTWTNTVFHRPCQSNQTLSPHLPVPTLYGHRGGRTRNIWDLDWAGTAYLCHLFYAGE